MMIFNSIRINTDRHTYTHTLTYRQVAPLKTFYKHLSHFWNSSWEILKIKSVGRFLFITKQLPIRKIIRKVIRTFKTQKVSMLINLKLTI